MGVPYTDIQIESASADLKAQADPEADIDDLLERYPGAAVGNFDGQPELTEMDALIAYLQRLGSDIEKETEEIE